MALDSRTRPARRSARRRLPQLTALILLTMAAGLWSWLCAPAASASAVAAPRLQVEAAQVDAATAPADSRSAVTAADSPAGASAHSAAATDTTGHNATTAASFVPTAPVSATAGTQPLAAADSGDGPLPGSAPGASGPRAPPVTS